MTYREMASVYDRLMEHAPYEKWLSFTKEIFKRSNKDVHTIVDLGCGTGEITTRLAQKGYELYGIDSSAEMLTYADQKANNQNLHIQWLQQDLRNFHGLTNLDVAISYCDVINYITSKEDIQSVFLHVAQALKPDGLFIFDVHSIFHVEHNLSNHTFADVTEELSYIWFCLPGNENGEMYHDLTFFVLEEGKYERFDESHHQQTYFVDTYVHLLQNAGFENIKLYGDFSLKTNQSLEKVERIFFLAEKRSG